MQFSVASDVLEFHTIKDEPGANLGGLEQGLSSAESAERTKGLARPHPTSPL